MFYNYVKLWVYASYLKIWVSEVDFSFEWSKAVL